GRSLGRRVGEVILTRHPELGSQHSLFDFGAIVAAAALAHDLGNPPFGHAGEDALGEFFRHQPAGQQYEQQVTGQQWQDLIKFEGNAQGFRLLTAHQHGLKLTAATLGAFTKYPCSSHLTGRDKARKSQRKFGFFQTEETYFADIAAACGLARNANQSWTRHPLAFLVEAADDICYSVIDLEDGCSLGLVDYEKAEELLVALLGKGKDKLGKLTQLRGTTEKIGYLRALAIGDLIDACAVVYLDQERQVLDGTFDRALADECIAKDSLAEIIKLSIDKIYRARHVVEIEAAGHEVLPGLLELFIGAGEHLRQPGGSRKFGNLAQLLPPEVASGIADKPMDTYLMLRSIVDFVSGLTDRRAISLYRQLKGFARLG
ncbi:MAG: dNTP triphosphohydrolase, partial [Bacteroidia bacterium]|nr:dNTP triphosphohydrolase [Bacteroidia bacterium]